MPSPAIFQMALLTSSYTPASASTFNMPAFVFAMQRNTATTGQLRIYYEADFSCEFTNVRPLEQVPSAMKLFAVA